VLDEEIAKRRHLASEPTSVGREAVQITPAFSLSVRRAWLRSCTTFIGAPARMLRSAAPFPFWRTTMPNERSVAYDDDELAYDDDKTQPIPRLAALARAAWLDGPVIRTIDEDVDDEKTDRIPRVFSALTAATLLPPPHPAATFTINWKARTEGDVLSWGEDDAADAIETQPPPPPTESCIRAVAPVAAVDGEPVEDTHGWIARHRAG
jgi:hypothetical protein